MQGRVGLAKINWAAPAPLAGEVGAELRKIDFLKSAVGRGYGKPFMQFICDQAEITVYVMAFELKRQEPQMDELIKGLDGPRTAQQELFYDLEDAAAVIGWSVVELTTLAASGRMPEEAITLMKICALLAAQQEKMGTYAGEVKDRRIIRSEIG